MQVKYIKIKVLCTFNTIKVQIKILIINSVERESITVQIIISFQILTVDKICMFETYCNQCTVNEFFTLGKKSFKSINLNQC